MNYLKSILATSLLVFAFVFSFGQTANIQLTVQNIEDPDGQLVIGLFDNADYFKAKINPFRATKVDITDSVISYTFFDVTAGNYAIAVFHDENGDGKVNTKSMKIPTEGVGVSGKMPKMRAPKFEDVAFKLVNDTVLVIQMVYPSSQ